MILLELKNMGSVEVCLAHLVAFRSWQRWKVSLGVGDGVPSIKKSLPFKLLLFASGILMIARIQVRFILCSVPKKSSQLLPIL